MKKVLKYLETLKISIISISSYKGDIFSSIIFLGVILFIFYSLWKSVFIIEGKGIIENFTLSKMIWYVSFTEAIMLSNPRIESRIDEEIKSGNISNYLTKPFYYPLFISFEAFGISLFKFFTKFPISIIISLILTLKLEGSVFGLISYIILGIIGLVLNILILILIGIFAFFIEDTQPIYWIYHKLLFTIGGLLIPLDMMPKFFQDLSKNLPFRFILYNPSYSYVNFSFSFLINSIIKGLLFIVIIFLLIFFIFYLAKRSISINGG